MFYDTHVHSAASPDSEMEKEEAIFAGKNAGLGVCFTEHVDFMAAPPVGVGDFVCDFGVYPREYEHLRGEGVLLGLEVGLSAEFLEKNKRVVQGDYDFIIGSVHEVDGVELYYAANKLAFENEQFTRDLHDPERVEHCIRRYLTYSREMVEVSDFFDSFGHVEYLAKMSAVARGKSSYGEFAGEFDGLLRAIIEGGVALEINTATFDDLGESGFAIFKRFGELGGRFCTVGSDAHRPHEIGRNFETARKMAHEAGLVPVYFKERKRVICGK
jgi:histidinol-phosphatase (PHP family)